MEEAVIIHENGGKRGIMTSGSLVYFYENEHKYCNRPKQGIVEEINPEIGEVTIRTFDGQILTNVSLYRVYL